MKLMGSAVVSVLGLAIAACGSHSHAPVVYGADTTHQGRIYNSPQQSARRAGYESRSSTRRGNGKDVEAAPLSPISAVYLGDQDAASATRVAAQSSGAQSIVTVQPGDTVYAIARRYQVSPKDIIALNGLRPPYRLEIDQVLRLPARSMASAAPTERKVVARDTFYRVRGGDTLYSISRASGVQPKTIAQANGLRPPYRLEVGQQLLLPQARVDGLYAAAPASQSAAQTQARAPQSVGELAQNVSYNKQPQQTPERLFDWPVRGAVIANYGAGELGRRNDGVNIAAPAGTPVRAAADGEVVYRGSELDGFGNLLLVKHIDGFVTAYAHNDAMLVKKGQRVRQGQVIAKVGKTGSVSTPQLHFEIRQNLKSVDPIALLGPQ